MTNKIIFLTVVIMMLACSACAKKPVLYPNEQYKVSGKTKVSEDIEYCLALAEKSVGKESRGKTSAKTGLQGGLIGGAIGFGIGIITGSPGTSALAGAAGGAAGGAASGALKDDSNSLYRKFVERCLKEKGYEPMGWK